MTTEAGLTDAHERRTLVRELRTRLDDLIGGRISRREVARWAERNVGASGLFGDAIAVLESLVSADEYMNDQPVLRSIEFEAYRMWLFRGEGLRADEQPLASIDGGLERLDSVHATDAVRFWYSGLGWWWERRFISTATGRPFLALATDTKGLVHIHTRRGDDAVEALADLSAELRVSPDRTRRSTETPGSATSRRHTDTP